MRYRLIKQEPYCCVARCLQMIFERNNIEYESQFQIANELGLIVTDLYKGTQIQKEEYSIDKYLKKHDIKLVFNYNFTFDYNVAKDILNKYKNDDIIVCFKRGVMYGKIMEGGHATIIDNIDNDLVTLLYPEDKSGYRIVKLEDLLEAIKIHGKDNMAGFWIFTKK